MAAELTLSELRRELKSLNPPPERLAACVERQEFEALLAEVRAAPLHAGDRDMQHLGERVIAPSGGGIYGMFNTCYTITELVRLSGRLVQAWQALRGPNLSSIGGLLVQLPPDHLQGRVARAPDGRGRAAIGALGARAHGRRISGRQAAISSRVVQSSRRAELAS